MSMSKSNLGNIKTLNRNSLTNLFKNGLNIVRFVIFFIIKYFRGLKGIADFS